MNPDLLRALALAADFAEALGLVAVLMMTGGLLYMLGRIARHRFAMKRRRAKLRMQRPGMGGIGIEW